MGQENPQKPPTAGLVTATVVFYLVAALAMVMANKWVLNSTSAPLFFLFTQLLIAVVLFVISHALGFLRVPLKYDWPLLRGLAPMILLNVVGLSANNYTLKYVDASFYQVARGMVLPFTILTSYFLLHSRPSRNVLLTCAIVTVGFFTGVFLDRVYPSPLGIFFGVASSVTTALHAVVIKRSLALCNGNALDVAWHSNLLSAAVIAPLVIVAGEGPAVIELFFGMAEPKTDGMSAFATFMWGSAITGVIGFLMCIASVLSIKITSPITHMVSSAVRGVAATFLGAWLFYDVITLGRAASISIILGGSILYTWVKHTESQRPPPSSKSGYERVPLDAVESGTATPESKPE